MGFTSLYLKALLRRKSDWIGTILGVLLATSLMFGAFMATDYAGLASINYEISKLPCDSTVTYSLGKFNTIASRISSIEEHIREYNEVSAVDSIALLYMPMFSVLKGNLNATEILGTTYLPTAVISRSHDFEGVQIDGDFSGLVLGYLLAKALNVSIGDRVNISFAVLNKTFSFVVTGIVRFGGRFYDAYSASIQGIYSYSSFYGYLGKSTLEIYRDPNYGLVFSYDSIGMLQDILDAIELYEISGDYTIFWLYNRSRVIDPWDIENSSKKIRNLDLRITQYLDNEFMGLGSAYRQYYFLQDTLNYVSMNLSFYKLQLVLNMIPVMILAVVLALVANWILVTRRKREIGLLKVKGTTGNSLMYALFVESALFGVIGGILGFLLGIGFLYYMGAEIYSAWNLTLNPIDVIKYVWDIYIIPAVVFGVILSVLSVYYPAKSVSKLSIPDALSGYTEELEAKVEVGKVIKIFFVITLVGLMDILLGMPTYRFVYSRLMQGMVFMAFLMMILFVVYMITFFAGPFILPYVSAKIIAANAHKLSKLLKFISGIFSRDMSVIATRQFIRKRSRAYKVILLLVLTLTFGSFQVINDATSANRMKINTQLSVGSDIRVDFLSLIPGDMINLSKYLDIEGISGYSRFSASYTSDGVGLYIVDKSYFEVSFIREGMLSIDINTAKEKLSRGGVIISKAYASSRKISVGDELNIDIYANGTVEEYNFTVVGVAYMLPGIADMFSAQMFNNFILILYDALPKGAVFDIQSLFIDVKENYNATRIAMELSDRFSADNINARLQVYDLALKNIEESWIYIYNRLFTQLMFYLSLIMAGAGIALTMTASIYERRREIALFRVRGASFSSLAGIILGELAIILFLGVGLGAVLALAYAYWFLVVTLKSSTIFTGSELVVPRDYIMTIPVSLPVIILLFVFLIFVFTLLPLYFVYKSEVTEELRTAVG